MNIEQPQASGIAFLLSQLGAHASAGFGQRVAELDLTPPLAGVLRGIGTNPGLSQQELARGLDTLPSKIVTFVDDLEGRELVTRTRSQRDRRLYELRLTEKGEQTLQRISVLAQVHEADLCAALDETEHAHLRKLLQRLADHNALHPGAHPGYRA